jgi:hypothetical protein
LIISLENLTNDIADAFVAIDHSMVPFRQFKPGVGPYGEPQLIKEVAKILDSARIGNKIKRILYENDEPELDKIELAEKIAEKLSDKPNEIPKPLKDAIKKINDIYENLLIEK